MAAASSCAAALSRRPARPRPFARARAGQTALARVEYPSNRLANVADLTENEPLDIAYPDDDSPGVLLKLGQRVEGGAGPDSDVVGFSVICPHKGFQMTYAPATGP